MVKVDLKGVASATVKGKTYYYAWRGGPRLTGEKGSPEFLASYNEAHAQRVAPDGKRFRGIVTLYKASADYQGLAPSTKKNWSIWLDRISDYFGGLSTAAFDRADKIRPVIRKWRDTYADHPRTADFGIQVLSRVLSYAVDPLSSITSNPCAGIKPLYSANRADIIWTADEIAHLKRHASPEIGFAVDLAWSTGLRRGDLLRLSWSHIGADQIIIATGKSNRRREAIVPLYDDLRDVLARIPKRATTVLTTTKATSWSVEGFASSFAKAKERAGIEKNFHDLRGTAATRFYTAGLDERVIAEIMGWEEDHVSKIIRRYVGRNAATQAAILQLNKIERRT